MDNSCEKCFDIQMHSKDVSMILVVHVVLGILDGSLQMIPSVNPQEPLF